MKNSLNKIIQTNINNNILIKNAQILDVANECEFLGEVLILEGKIAEVNNYKKTKSVKENKSYQIINANSAYLSPAFIDVGVHLESASDKSLEEITQKAIESGVATVILTPQINCPLDNPAVMRSINKFNIKNKKVNVLALGAIAKDYKALQMSEVGTLLESGAVGITIDPMPEDLRLLVQFLRYASSFNSQFNFKIWANPQELTYNKQSLVNEGVYSSKYGLATMPNFAETIGIAKLIEILEYQKQISEKYLSGAHIQNISTARSASLVANNPHLSAGIPIVNLLYNDSVLAGFNAEYRTSPPIRSVSDQIALRQAVIASSENNDNKFLINSNHYDFNEEQIKVPFGEVRARGGRFGVIDNLLAGVVQIAREEDFPLIKLLKTITTIPAKLINREELAQIKIGQSANLCVFNISQNGGVVINHVVVNGNCK